MMELFNPARWLLYAAFAAALALGAWRLDQSRQQIGYDRAQAEYTDRALKAEAAARVAEQAKVQAVAEIDQKHQKELAHVKADHDAAVADLDSLLTAVSRGGTVPKDTAAASRADDASRLRYIFGQCAASLTELAEVADTIESRMTGLQDYVKTACLK